MLRDAITYYRCSDSSVLQQICCLIACELFFAVEKTSEYGRKFN